MERVKVLVDVNILLDVLQEREPFYSSSALGLASIEAGHVDGFIAAHTATTLFYLIAKYRSPEYARVAITDLLQFVSIAAVDQMTIERALNLSYCDFEDAVQMAAALQCGAQYVLTRNVKDFQEGPLPALQPAELLTLL